MWSKIFQKGVEYADDKHWSFRPSTSTTDESVKEVKKMSLGNNMMTFLEVADDERISAGLCHWSFLMGFVISHLSMKLVPGLLSLDQEKKFIAKIKRLYDAGRNPDLLKRALADEPSCAHLYDAQTQSKWSQWKGTVELMTENELHAQSNKLVWITVFFEWRTVFLQKLLPHAGWSIASINLKIALLTIIYTKSFGKW